MSIPSAIFFVNADLTPALRLILAEQLNVTESMTDTEFDLRVSLDPNYATVIHGQKLRVLVIRSNFHDMTNRNLADVVMFVKQGLVSIEKNNFGPPGLTLPLERLNLYSLLRYNKSSEVVVLPTTGRENSSALGGIFALQTNDPSGVHDANTDNEAHNTDFINRK